MEDQKMRIPIKLQVINYEDEENQLGKFYVSTNDRLSKKQAEDILNENNVEYKQVFQVRKEEVILKVTIEEIEDLIQ